ncbi:MAG: hypothetical protein IJR44_01775, partial [Neisseriaceae bacterium]|nr:hypothetical protein [Neisseriaceae bacterium]
SPTAQNDDNNKDSSLATQVQNDGNLSGSLKNKQQHRRTPYRHCERAKRAWQSPYYGERTEQQ